MFDGDGVEMATPAQGTSRFATAIGGKKMTLPRARGAAAVPSGVAAPLANG